MGDILHALPAVAALRRAHPEWLLGWAVEPRWSALLRAESAGPGDAGGSPEQPLVDRLHSIPAKQWTRQPLRPATLGSMFQARAELRRAGYDAAIDLQGAVRSAVIARWAGPGRLLGEAAPREPAARWLFQERVATRGVHVIEQAGEVVERLAGESLTLGLPVLPRDLEAARWCDAAGVPVGGPDTVLLHPGAGWGAKRWPVERHAKAAAAIARETGARIAINAAPGEPALGSELEQRLRELGVEPLLLSPTVGQLIELTRRVALAIGGDTGPLHLAAALGVPTVAIFGPTDPARNGPFHGEFRVLRDPASRRDHARRAAPEAGLLRISAVSVAEAAVALLPARAGNRRA